MTSYPYDIQIAMVISCMFLHNFIRINQSGEDIFYNYNEDDEDQSNDVQFHEWMNTQQDELNDWRDQIAIEMWNSYIAYNS